VKRAIIIGNFDGVHLGHQSIVKGALARAAAMKLELFVLTFDPHPSVVLGRASPQNLTLLARKRSLLEALGVAQVHVEPFTAAFSALSPEDFVQTLLVDVLRTGLVLVGSDFRFGKNRAGTTPMLRALGSQHGFEVHALDLIEEGGSIISSTRIRRAIADSDVALAAHLLGRSHSLSGVVEHGAERGRTLGFPTANLGTPREALPGAGVYAVQVDLLAQGQEQPQLLGAGVMNLGLRPTVSQNANALPTVEVHLFESPGDIYGQTLRVHLVAKIREERKFESLDALKAQITEDAERAKQLTRKTDA
jgi:riboflavin kinase / FMN adenylyltransferase